MVKERNCPCCNNNDYTDLDHIIADKMRLTSKCTKVSADISAKCSLALCNFCQLVYYRIIPENIFDHYKTGYRRKEEMQSIARKRENSKKIALWLHLLKPILGDKKLKILDIGCAEGFFIEHLKKMGHTVVGCELNDMSVEIARENGLVIYDKDILEINNPSFDLVFNSGYIEHVEEPRKIIDHIWKNLLKPEGHLYIQTPDVLCPSREYLSEFFPIEHFQTFSVETLSNLLIACGFEPIFTKTDVYNSGLVVLSKKGNQTGSDPQLCNTDYMALFNDIKRQHDRASKGLDFVGITEYLKAKKHGKTAVDHKLISNNYMRMEAIGQLIKEADPDYRVGLYYALQDYLHR